MRLLLDCEGIDPKLKGQLWLSWSAKRGHEAVVRLLMESEGIKPDSKDSNGYTPLTWAACYGHEAVAELLLKKGADAEANNNDGRTALHGAT